MTPASGLDDVLVTGLAAAPIIAALLQVIKPFVPDSRWWPLIAIAMGVAWSLAVNAALPDAAVSDVGWIAAGLRGVVTGMAASGIYSATKNLRERALPAQDTGGTSEPPG
jgi:hypothetical protein